MASLHRLVSSIMVFACLTACGGGGGGGDNSTPTPSPEIAPGELPGSSTSNSSSSSSSSGSSSSGANTVAALALGTPSAKPSVIPPATSQTQVVINSIVSGGEVPPDVLFLDEIDSTGALIASAVAELRDDGETVDKNLGDRVYSGTILVGSAVASEKFYRVRAIEDGDTVISGRLNFWVSGCPVTARPSDNTKVVLDSATGAYIFSNEVMMSMAPGVAPDLGTMNQIAGQVGGQVVGCIPALREYLVEFPGDDTAQGVYQAIDILEDSPEVTSASPNGRVLSQPIATPALCEGEECQWYLQRIRAPEAWKLAGGGDEQRAVAVIDFGVDCRHSELGCDGNLFNEDIIDHGTGVASLIGARADDGTSVVGVAWNTDLYPLSFLGEGGSHYKMSELITSSLNEDNIKVLNISAATALDIDGQIRDSICTAIGSGRLVVAAAGNAATSKNCELAQIYPAQYNQSGVCSNGVNLQDGLLVVGATDQNNDLAEWSEECSNQLYVDMFAPGKDIYTASAREGYTTKSGTSYATPLVSGAAAVLWSAQPALTVDQVHQQLLATGAALGSGAENPRGITDDPRLQGKRLLDVFAALGGQDIVVDGASIEPDSEPDVFTFTDRDEQALASNIVSAPVTITGIDSYAPIDIEGGYYSINNKPFTGAAGVIQNNDQVRVRLRSAATPETATNATLTIGGLSDVFTVITTSAATTLDNMSFVDNKAAPVSENVESNIVTLTDIADATPISISGGEYSLNGGAYTDASGTINPGDSVQIRVTSGDNYNEKKSAEVTIGNVTETFEVSTKSVDSIPDKFYFADIDNAALSSVQVSEPVTISGINVESIISISAGQYAIDNGEFTSDAGTISNGQRVHVQLNAAATPATSRYATLTINGISDTFRVTTLNPDVVAESFSFVDQTNVPLNSEIMSNTITVNGINTAVPISISAGEYRINNGAFTSDDGLVRNGDTVEVRLYSSANIATTLSAVLNIGSVSDTFTVSTEGATLPDNFDFENQVGVPLNSVILSNVQSITGLNSDVTISITNGEYAIDDGEFTSAEGTIGDNATLQLRTTSSSEFNTSTQCTINIGGVSDSFTVTTLALDASPDAFTFADLTDAALNSLSVSNEITVTGINAAVAISVSGGEYAIDGGSFTTSPGTISNGQSVQVRVNTASTPETASSATLSIGNISDTFTATTLSADTTPDTFTFINQSNVATNTPVISNAMTVSGINTAVPVSITAGSYRINGGSFTSANGSVENGDSLEIRLTSSANVSTTVSSTLTIGTESSVFNVSTVGATLPDSFAFSDISGAARGSTVTSEEITITGLNSTVPVSISGGEYSIDGGAFTNGDGVISNNQSLQLRVTTASSFNTTSSAEISVSGITDTFSVTTELEDINPLGFSFIDTGDAALDALVSSNTIVISGINSAAPISVSGGEYAIDDGTFRATDGTIVNGQRVTVRGTASAIPETTVDITLSVGNVSDTFSITTIDADTTPSSFSFNDIEDAALNANVTSNSILVTGINTTAPISVSNGSYSINAGAFTSQAGEVSPGDSVRVRGTASAEFSTSINTVLTIGGVSDTFTITTLAADTTPAAFSFVDQTGVALSTPVSSNAITISGINSAASVSVSGGEYSINGAGYTSAAGVANNGDSIRVRLTSADAPNTAAAATLTVGGIADTFSVTTELADTQPDNFTFVSQSNISLSTAVISNAVSITGINTATPVSINNGEYRIDGGPFTSNAGTVVNGASIEVRLNSSPDPETTTSATLTVGDTSASFSVTSVDADTTPDEFSFNSQTNVALNTPAISNSIVISGINTAAPITINGGEYRIDNGAYRTTAGTVNEGDTVTVRITAGGVPETTSDATVSIGGVIGTFTITTVDADTTPTAFSFSDATNVALNEQVVSNPIVISGINTQTPISVTGGEYRINGGGFTSTAGSVNDGDTIEVRVTAAAEPETTRSATLNVGDLSDTFAVTTVAADTTPNAFSFTAQTDVEPNTLISSNTITITGINTSAPINISGGEYRIGSGAFTSAAGTVSNGQQVQVQLTSSSTNSTLSTATLIVGTFSRTFSVTTRANSAPTASNVGINDRNGGQLAVRDSLRGSYVFNDSDGDPEGTSTYQWYRNGEAMDGSTFVSYTLTEADIGAEFVFEVTPVASSGTTTGAPVRSDPLVFELTVSEFGHYDSGQLFGGSGILAIATGDVDRDGDNDIIIGKFSGANQLWLNDGFGYFTDSGYSFGNSDTRALALVDVDNDGDLDLIEACQGSNYSARENKLWINNGIGEFSDSGRFSSNYQNDSWALDTGDINNDGYIDVVFANTDTGNEVWINNRDGSFSQTSSLGTFQSQGIAVGDVDGDDDLDVVEGNTHTVANVLWINQGNGTFSASNQDVGSSGADAVLMEDFDNDNDIDIFVFQELSNGKLFLNNGNGVFSDSGQSYNGGTDAVTADFDNNGYLDIVVIQSSNADAVLQNNGGTFVDVGLDMSSWQAAMDVADLNNDGNPDIIARKFDAGVRIYLMP